MIVISSSTPNHLSALTYTIAVEQKATSKWTAKVLGAEFGAEGNTREEALEHLEQRLIQELASVEILQMEIHVPKPENPLLALAGKYKDDPDFDEVVIAIQDYRREVDAANNGRDE
jgi:hypothetical protein